jgi:hypothetical protein
MWRLCLISFLQDVPLGFGGAQVVGGDETVLVVNGLETDGLVTVEPVVPLFVDQILAPLDSFWSDAYDDDVTMPVGNHVGEVFWMHKIETTTMTEFDSNWTMNLSLGAGLRFAQAMDVAPISTQRMLKTSYTQLVVHCIEDGYESYVRNRGDIHAVLQVCERRIRDRADLARNAPGAFVEPTLNDGSFVDDAGRRRSARIIANDVRTKNQDEAGRAMEILNRGRFVDDGRCCRSARLLTFLMPMSRVVSEDDV